MNDWSAGQADHFVPLMGTGEEQEREQGDAVMVHPISKLPKFEQVRREIEERIRSGEYRHGDYLPSEEELAAFFAVGRNTIRKAVELLLDNHLIVKQQGRVSRINCPERDARPRRVNRLAWFTNYSPSNASTNMIYFELFKQMVGAAALRDFQVDFLSTDSPNCWPAFQDNRESYAGVFSVGISRGNTDRGLLERLESLDNLIAIDELGDSPARHLVAVDNFEGGRLAARHLLQCGYRRPAMVSIDNDYLAFRERQRGFEEELRLCPGVEGRMVWLDQRQQNCLAAGVEMHWDEIASADAVFGYCDETAMAILVAARYHNRAVPGELGVIGFDGLAVAQHMHPRLSSVDHPAAEVVSTAIELALELAAKPGQAPRRIRLCGKLLPGETTRIVAGGK